MSALKVDSCQACGGPLIHRINLGHWPVANRFLEDGSTRAGEEFQREVAQCKDCGLVQQTSFIPVENIKPIHPWLTCTEPEDHLDELTDKIVNLADISEKSRFLGITFKEETLFDRLNRRGYENTHILNMQDDLGIEDEKSNVESVQWALTDENAKKFVESHGLQDVVVCRHTVEHAYSLKNFLGFMSKVSKPNAVILLEIPDCQRSFEKRDLTTFWEEHTIYFTESTFRNLFSQFGLSVSDFYSVEYPLENAIVGISRKADKVSASVVNEGEWSRFARFADSYQSLRDELYRSLEMFKVDNSGKIALFGAGHMSVDFVNLYGLSDLVDVVLDDNTNKVGRVLSGSQLPIYPGCTILEDNISLCLSSLSPISDEKVKAKYSSFLEGGGRFLSIFPGNENSVHSFFELDDN